MNPEPTWLTALTFDQDGLIPAIAQDAQSGVVLMMAWMNAEAVTESARTGRAVYYSRSRQRLWRKGEASGHIQIIHEIRLDCDADVLLLKVTQEGGIACHTGRAHCFFRRLEQASGATRWTTVEPVLKDPTDIYSSNKP